MQDAKPRQWLIDARRAERLTQEDMADLLNVARTTYNRYETGQRTPSPHIADLISNILDVKREHFFWDF